ncbi:uncharacterized protein L969DRAFT_83824 [Mixia osmundae IAM 14324]|uniref:Thioesterase domain-containing protein n=1 Tax=Mixia osmundae (strain CBS 9802 / IAM 14324 / JCM 22182 / KY 12970) TaxID=764103 RepID=G7E3W6_MIXOS|nr:uncharacterized protein L969DRAFT_83824 [Mixia osmundae IAM 14324]KEI41971.1 hypothetical protein L969DRAFT_83824 [Mixia osmundae IAM 14324]GAA97526.1 hypothetical protein E5Q_04204 [Mixia osmundae IAM 14324]
MSGPGSRLSAFRSHLSPVASPSAISLSPTVSSAGARHASTSKPPRQEPEANAKYYRYWLPFQSRWADNDMYGHMNNAQYSFYFDSLINQYLIARCGQTPTSTDKPIGLIISSSTTYLSSLAFPSPFMAALSVDKIGRSSVRYRVALFPARAASQTGQSGALAKSEQDRVGKVSLELEGEQAAAFGELTHVFCDPVSRRPTDIPPNVRKGLEELLVP